MLLPSSLNLACRTDSQLQLLYNGNLHFTRHCIAIAVPTWQTLNCILSSQVLSIFCKSSQHFALSWCRGRSVEKPPLELGGMWLPWTTLSGDLLCTPWLYVTAGCLLKEEQEEKKGRGILPWEYNHVRSQQHVEANSSTIYAVHDKGAEHAAGDAVEEGHFALAQHVVEIDAATEAETLQPLQDRPLLLLDNLVHVLLQKAWQSKSKSMRNSGRNALCWTLLHILLSTVWMEMNMQSPWPILACLIDRHASAEAGFTSAVMLWCRHNTVVDVIFAFGC